MTAQTGPYFWEDTDNHMFCSDSSYEADMVFLLTCRWRSVNSIVTKKERIGRKEGSQNICFVVNFKSRCRQWKSKSVKTADKMGSKSVDKTNLNGIKVRYIWFRHHLDIFILNIHTIQQFYLYMTLNSNFYGVLWWPQIFPVVFVYCFVLFCIVSFQSPLF